MALHAGTTGGATSVAAASFPLTPPAGTASISVNSAILVDAGTGIMALKNTAPVSQEWRVYGSNTAFTSMSNDGTNGKLYSTTGGSLLLGSSDGSIIFQQTGVGNLWQLTVSNGIYPLSNNSYDIGVTPNNLVRTGYYGTSVVVGTAGWTASATAATGLTAQGNHRFAHGTSALATSATEGFFHLQSAAGVPTGTPANIPTGQKPLVLDSNADQLNFYSTSWKALPRTLDVNVAAVGCVNATNSNLISFTIPANVLVTNNKCIRVRAYGTTANNVAGKNLFFVVGSQTVLTTALTASIAGQWEVEALITRTGANTQDIVARTLQGATLIFDQELTAGTQTETATIAIKCVAQGGASNDIVQEGMITEVIN